MNRVLLLFALVASLLGEELCRCELRKSKCLAPTSKPNHCMVYACEEFVCLERTERTTNLTQECVLTPTSSFVTENGFCESVEVMKPEVRWAARQQRKRQTVRPSVHGWLVERLFHEKAITCPWTEEPSSDSECQERTQKLQGYQHKLGVCDGPYTKSLKSIAHRGSPLMAPEETVLSYDLAMEQGSGYLECDAGYTKDFKFVCRHSVCDLHTTTDILANHPEMAERCSVPFRPAGLFSSATAKCCTYDFPMEELKQLCGIMDSQVNSDAKIPQEYLLGPSSYQTTAYQSKPDACYQLMSYEEHLTYSQQLNVNVIPELKDTTDSGFNKFLNDHGKDYLDVALQFVEEMVDAGYTASLGEEENVGILQTFDRRVAAYWAGLEPRPLVEYLWSSRTACSASNCGTDAELVKLKDAGVQIFAPAIPLFLANDGHILTSSEYIHQKKALIGPENHLASWTLERSACTSPLPTRELNPSNIGPCGFYYNGFTNQSVFQELDVFAVMDVLFNDVGILSLFSDFPGTVSAYANCIN